MSDQLKPGDRVHDTRRRRDATVRTSPGIYGKDTVWVRPDGEAGWPARIQDLNRIEPQEAACRTS